MCTVGLFLSKHKNTGGEQRREADTEVILQLTQPCWGHAAKVSHNYWFVVNTPSSPLQFSLLWDLLSPWLVLKALFLFFFSRVSLATAPLRCISISSPAPSIDGSREQLVKRDKVMFWVLHPSRLPCTTHPSAGMTMRDAGGGRK